MHTHNIVRHVTIDHVMHTSKKVMEEQDIHNPNTLEYYNALYKSFCFTTYLVTASAWSWPDTVRKASVEKNLFSSSAAWEG